MEQGQETGPAPDAAEAIRARLLADRSALEKAIGECRLCPGGGRGISGRGGIGPDLFFLAGMPGPGASGKNPWGEWRDPLMAKMRAWGWDAEHLYFSTALRCRLPRVTRAEVRRCAPFLAEELLITGPRLVVASGKIAAVCLRAALGDAVPDKPRAGDTASLHATRFLFELDVARIAKEKEAEEVFWSILSRARDIFPARGGGARG